MNNTRKIGAGLFIIGILNIISGQSPKIKKYNIKMRDLGGVLLFTGAIVYWFGLVGENENRDFAIFD